MKKCILAVVMAIVAVLNVQSATHAKVQLWEGGPYWATTNIGADNPWDYGLYFWWGDTVGHRPSGTTFNFSFSSSNCPTYNKSIDTLWSEGWIASRYDYPLAPAHDAAHEKWGGRWRMPRYFGEMKDLIDKCDWTWTTMNGVKGYVVRGRGDYASNSIFLPATGRGYQTLLSDAGSVGYYRSSDLSSYYPHYSICLSFGSGGYSSGQYDRFCGYSVRPVQDFNGGAVAGGAVADCVVHFNANGGTGNMDEQIFEEGNEQKLSKNTYRKDGYVFQGWAVVADGEVVYKDEASITVDSDMTLYAVWANPPLTLTAESANWSSGSITLRCEDADTSGAEHEYYLSYYEAVENEKKWYDIDGATRVKASLEVDSNGNSVLVARLTDERFSKRNMGWSTVKYRVNDETGRMAECETRNRHGLFVALDLYEDRPHWGLVEQPSPTHEAAVFRSAYSRYGGTTGHLETLENWSATKHAITNRLDFCTKNYLMPGDVFLFYHAGHGFNGGVACYGLDEYLLARELSVSFRSFPPGVGIVAIIYACHSASMIDTSDTDGTAQIGWIASSQATETTLGGQFNEAICEKGWFKGMADISDGYGLSDGDGYVTFGELAGWGQQEMARNSAHYYGRMMDYWNSSVLRNIVAGKVPQQDEADNEWAWLTKFKRLLTASNGDVATAAAMTAANGCRTVGECYALGIDPEDPDDDFKVTHFEMKDGKPVITLNHTEDGSGNSFMPRVKTLGKADLSDAEWREVPEDGDDTMRFFKVEVEMP